MKVFLLDNYDSFTYNIYQYLGTLGADVIVRRNDEFDIEEMEKWGVSAVIISPGPSRPENAGLTVEFIRQYAGRVPILGVCLGHQAIAYAFGARIVRAKRVMHGKTSDIFHDGKGVFYRMRNPFQATRYHSLVVDSNSLPEMFSVSAWTVDNEIMGIRHREWLLEGVQFHPESILTEDGILIFKNFLELSEKYQGG